MTSEQDQRDEGSAERLDRNWDELLQELRVSQTGVQILTGFLLTIPFSQRFGELEMVERNVYLAALAGSVVTTGLLVAPVAFHRVLFRRGEKAWLVDAANWMARAGLAALSATICTVLWLVFHFVLGDLAAAVAVAAGGTFFVLVWGVAPLLARPPSS